ncbi:M15 family metallopeptidase [Ancylobacter sp. IITR112]|uniref:M15 family metallopeptidase n=1 Tax=Ancylobacter sp. IITR112 TaxID=3138073 RepID=UPI00352A10F4
MLRIFLLMLAAAVPAALTVPAHSADLPDGFVRLKSLAPGVQYDLRYTGSHNFVGRPIRGYEASECILTRPAAEALAKAAEELAPQGLGLKIYDCYRPARAVADFVAWAKDLGDVTMKPEFYPRVPKDELFARGYIAEKSGHSRGSTVDLALVRLDAAPARPWLPGDPLADCALPVGQRFDDGTLDFGTGYDCFDVRAHHGAEGIASAATANRLTLKTLMERHGFKPYAEEWWHYTLADEPFPDTYFDFPVTAGQ